MRLVVWFLLPLWSGKESQWSKSEQLFHAEGRMGGTMKEGHLPPPRLLGGCQTELNININNNNKKKNNKVNSRLRAWRSGVDVQHVREGRRSVCVADVAHTDCVLSRPEEYGFLQGALTRLRLPGRCCVRQTPHSPVKKQGTINESVRKCPGS